MLHNRTRNDLFEWSEDNKTVIPVDKLEKWGEMLAGLEGTE